MTLTNADYLITEPRYMWRCASCSRIFGVNMPVTPAMSWAENYNVGLNGNQPSSADECREAALRCCALAALQATAIHDTQWMRPAAGALPEQIRFVAPLPAPGLHLRPSRERVPHERVFPLVALGSPEVWARGHHSPEENHYPPSEIWDRTFEIEGIRLDVVIDDEPERQNASWIVLLSGVRIDLEIGTRNLNFTVQNRRFLCKTCNEGEELFGVRHAFTQFSPSIQNLPRQRLFARVDFLHGDEIPIAFARIVAHGYLVRDVQ